MRGFATLALMILLCSCAQDAELNPDSTEEAYATLAIPPKFHGVWEYPRRDCVERSSGVLEIRSQEVLDYEGWGTVKDLTVTPDGMIVDLAWLELTEPMSRRIRLIMESDGEALSFQSQWHDQASWGPIQDRERCPR